MNALLLLAAFAAAQLSITAEVNKTALAVDDELVLSVTVTGDSAALPEPVIPPLPAFNVYSSGRSHSISIVNGRATGNAVFTYVLRPRAVGKSTIGPITVNDGSKTFSTQPIELQVLPAGSRAQRAAPRRQEGDASLGPDAFMTAVLDKKRAYVNEQVTLTIRFHIAVPPTDSPNWTPPRLRGFLPEELPHRELQLQTRGRSYYVSEIRTALFPLESGKLTVEPAKATVRLHSLPGFDAFGGSLMERFLRHSLSAGEQLDLATDPVTLQVDPLPAEGKPAGFNGAVGDYTIELRADRTSVKAGEAVNLTLVVSGRGNPKTIGDVRLPEQPTWRLYDPVATVDVRNDGETISGSKTLKYVAVPRVSGELTIPPVELPFFDPKTRRYRTARTAPVRFQVAPGDASTKASADFTAKGLTSVSEDIRHLKARGPSAATRALEAVAGAGPLHSAPALFFAASAALAWRRRRLESDPRRARAAAALRVAQELAAKGALAEALTRFLGDKLGEPSAALTQRRASELLAARGVDAAEVRRLWTELEARRFAPGGASLGDLAGPLLELLKRLDKELS